MACVPVEEQEISRPRIVTCARLVSKGKHVPGNNAQSADPPCDMLVGRNASVRVDHGSETMRITTALRPANLVLYFSVAIGGIAVSTESFAADYHPGVVTKNTFVLSENADTPRDNLLVHDLVGYLPVGTRVYYLDVPVSITNLRTGTDEIYYRVRSNIGINGLLREDRFVKVSDKPIAVSVASYEVPLFDVGATVDSPRHKFNIERYGGHYLEIESAEDPVYYTAILHRAQTAAGLPATERVKLKKLHVNVGAVVLVPPETLTREQLSVPHWSARQLLDDTFIAELVEDAKENFEDEIDQVRDFLGDLNTLQCLLKASADAEFGFRIFGNGLGFNVELDIKEQDHMYAFERHDLTIEGTTRTYILLRNVLCDGSTPERLVRLTMQEGAYNPSRREYIRLKDLKETNSPWVVSLHGRTAPLRMIRIDGEPAYINALKQLEKLVLAARASSRAFHPPNRSCC